MGQPSAALCTPHALPMLEQWIIGWRRGAHLLVVAAIRMLLGERRDAGPRPRLLDKAGVPLNLGILEAHRREPSEAQLPNCEGNQPDDDDANRDGVCGRAHRQAGGKGSARGGGKGAFGAPCVCVARVRCACVRAACVCGAAACVRGAYIPSPSNRLRPYSRAGQCLR